MVLCVTVERKGTDWKVCEKDGRVKKGEGRKG